MAEGRRGPRYIRRRRRTAELLNIDQNKVCVGKRNISNNFENSNPNLLVPNVPSSSAHAARNDGINNVPNIIVEVINIGRLNFIISKYTLKLTNLKSV